MVSVYIPLLERTGMNATVQAARLPHPSLPKLRSQLRLPGLRFYFSPARVRRVMRVLHSALPGTCVLGRRGNAHCQESQPSVKFRAASSQL